MNLVIIFHSKYHWILLIRFNSNWINASMPLRCRTNVWVIKYYIRVSIILTRGNSVYSIQHTNYIQTPIHETNRCIWFRISNNSTWYLWVVVFIILFLLIIWTLPSKSKCWNIVKLHTKENLLEKDKNDNGPYILCIYIFKPVSRTIWSKHVAMILHLYDGFSLLNELLSLFKPQHLISWKLTHFRPISSFTIWLSSSLLM